MNSSLTTKEFLCMCFLKTKVIRYTTFFQSSGQLLFGTTSLLLYVFLTYFRKRKTTARQIIVYSRSTRQKQYRSYEICIKVTIKRVSDIGASSLDVVLVSLLLTFNKDIVCRFVVSCYFCQLRSAGICLFKFSSRNTRTQNMESLQS